MTNLSVAQDRYISAVVSRVHKFDLRLGGAHTRIVLLAERDGVDNKLAGDLGHYNSFAGASAPHTPCLVALH